jgi:hypothetical protein
MQPIAESVLHRNTAIDTKFFARLVHRSARTQQ